MSHGYNEKALYLEQLLDQAKDDLEAARKENRKLRAALKKAHSDLETNQENQA